MIRSCSPTPVERFTLIPSLRYLDGTKQRGTKLKRRLPSLRVGVNHTRHSAIHPLRCLGPLNPWRDFERVAWEECDEHGWRRRQHILDHKHRGEFYISSVEMTDCGDETGVQGRWNQQMGQVMSSVMFSQKFKRGKPILEPPHPPTQRHRMQLSSTQMAPL